MKQKIFVIDGEPIVRKAVTSILERAGFQVTATDSVQDALEHCKKGPPALVITNVLLPGISGHDAMRLIKKACPDVPVLMVSGLPSEPIISEWMNQDRYDVFPKPFMASDLVAKVHQMLLETTS